jgi:hypothetical protein
MLARCAVKRSSLHNAIEKGYAQMREAIDDQISAGRMKGSRHRMFDQPQSAERKERAGLIVLALLLAALGLLAFSLYRSPLSVVPTLPDSRFVMTTVPTLGLPSNASLKDRAALWTFRLFQRFRKLHPRPLAYGFPASPTNRCSIQGLLNQCMEVCGVTYLIPKEVAAGTVQFGHTNSFNGEQWVAAFTDLLRNGQPEWWDSKVQRFRRENLVLVTNGPRSVLVLPADMVKEFQK